MTSVETVIQAMVAAIGFVFGVIFIAKYREGRTAVNQLNREKIQGKQNEIEKQIYKKYDDMSLDELSKSSGSDSSDKSRSGS